MHKDHTVAVVIPAYNEEQNIGRVIDAIPGFVDQVIVVDDGSVDGTAEIAHQKNALVVRHNANKGVGAAFNSGVNKVLELNYDLMVNMDADGQFNPADIIHIITPIVEHQADFVTASRFKDKSFYPEMSRVKFLGNRFMSWFVSRLTKQRFYDVSCGFRAYRRETLLRLNLFGDFTYTQESFIDLAFKKLVIREIPVAVRGKREHGKSRVASNLFRYAYQTSKIIIRAFRDYKPFKLFGFVSLFAFLVGLGFGVFLLIHYIQQGEFSPHKWAGFVSGFFVILSLFFLIIGFILDMFARMRMNQEEIMYQLKRQFSNG